MLKTVAKVIGAIFLIVLGILFLAYLQRAPTEVASDAIFIGAGLLLIRSAYLDGKSAKAAATAQTAKGARKKPLNKSDKKKGSSNSKGSRS